MILPSEGDVWQIMCGDYMAGDVFRVESSYEVGRKGEDMALKYLQERGMRLVARNWRSGHKELDLIMNDGEFLRVVEVKSLNYPNTNDPFGAVDIKKRRRIVAAAHHFALLHNVREEVVFDVVSVLFNGENYKIEYFEEAFSPCCL